MDAQEMTIWGKENGSEFETLLFSGRVLDKGEVNFIEEAATRQGFTDIRVSIIDMTTPPDFKGAVNV